MAEGVEKNGVYVTFFCGRLGRQLVEVSVGSEHRELTLVEFNDLVHDALTVMVQRLGDRNLIRR